MDHSSDKHTRYWQYLLYNENSTNGILKVKKIIEKYSVFAIYDRDVGGGDGVNGTSIWI